MNNKSDTAAVKLKDGCSERSMYKRLRKCENSNRQYQANPTILDESILPRGVRYIQTAIWHLFLAFYLVFYLTCGRIQLHSTASACEKGAGEGRRSCTFVQNLETLTWQAGSKQCLLWDGNLVTHVPRSTPSFTIFPYTHVV